MTLHDVSRDGRVLTDARSEPRGTRRPRAVGQRGSGTSRGSTGAFWPTCPRTAGLCSSASRVRAAVRATRSSSAARTDRLRSASGKGSAALPVSRRQARPRPRPSDGRPAAQGLSDRAGEAKVLSLPNLRVQAAKWLPDGRRFLMAARSRDTIGAFTSSTSEGGAPKPLTPEGYRTTQGGDGTDATAHPRFRTRGPDAKSFVHTIEGGERRARAGDRTPTSVMSPGTGRRDGLAYVGERDIPARILRFDLATGKEEPRTGSGAARPDGDRRRAWYPRDARRPELRLLLRPEALGSCTSSRD